MTSEELKSLVGHPDFYDRWAKEDLWDFLAIISGRAFQGAEINEIQHVLDEKISALGRTLYADGTVIEGCDIAIDPDAGVADLGAGKVALDGKIRGVEAARLNIPGGDARVGIWLKARVITEKEDGSFLSPAVGMGEYRKPGAYRIVVTAEWGLDGEGLTAPFYAIYRITNWQVSNQYYGENTPEWLDALARYDRDSNSHYVVEGLRVTALPNADSADDGVKQTYSISEGLAHVRGYEARLSHAVRLVVEEDADLYQVQSEAHQYDSTGGQAVIPVHQTPIEAIASVRVTKERTVELTHGSYTGCSDDLPDTSVIKIVSVVQGGTTYTDGTDFQRNANRVDWSLMGAEPAPGSRYTVVYHYRTNVTPDASDATSLTLSGLVEGSLVELDYTYRMPRRDKIVIYKDSTVALVKGVPHRYAPVLPATPSDALCLAEVEQGWVGLPKVSNVAVQAVRMDDLNEMQEGIRALYRNVASLKMQMDASFSAPTSADNVFVDPLFDDDMRDAGTPQTAMIAGQALQLPMEIAFQTLETGRDLALAASPVPLIVQEQHTKCMKVNPYLAFDPMPVQVGLTPAVDRWTDTARAREIINAAELDALQARAAALRKANSGWTLGLVTVGQGTVLTEDAEGTLRQIDVALSAAGFGPGEGPIALTFDGLQIPYIGEDHADAGGKWTCTFTIPAGVPTGSRLVHVEGPHSQGDAIFVGIRNISTAVTRLRYSVFRATPVDPLAQTFMLNEDRHVAGVDFWLCQNGVSRLRVEIRETDLGFPTQDVVAQCVLDPADLNAGTWNRAIFETPALLTAGTMYAITLLSDTSDHEVGITELGDYDTETGWVRSQAYQTGVLLSSSNANTWTAHQSADLAFRLLGADFHEHRQAVELGTLDLTGMTDILAMAEVETTSAATGVTFVLRKEGAEVARMQAWQGMSFAEPLDGAHTLEAELFGDAKYSPILGRDPQVMLGKVGTFGDYVSRAFKCGAGKRVMVTTSDYAPVGATVKVYVETASGVWTEAAASTSEPIGDGWYRDVRFVPCDLAQTRLKIELTGGPGARPMVTDISAVVLPA